MVLRRETETPEDRIAAVTARLETWAETEDKAGSDAARIFFARYFQRMAEDDLLARSPEDLAGQAQALWHFAAIRPAGKAKLRVYNPDSERDGWASPHTAIEIVNDDMPFLVDSVGMALSGLGREIHLLQHPLVPLCRDGTGRRVAAGPEAQLESLMHIEVDAEADPERLAEIETILERSLADVRAAVEDWGAMRAKLEETLADLTHKPPPLDADEMAEALSLLRWMADDNFIFLGYREYRYRAAPGAEPMHIATGDGLGILADPARRVMVGATDSTGTSAEVLRFLHRQEPLIVTKANARSSVHRAVPLDYIGVRRFDVRGRVLGERRFVGLFTSAAYNRNPRDIPLLRRKVRRVVERAGLAAQSHDGKALLNILETYPRDELFQIGEDELFRIASGILVLQSRPRIRLFLRRDDFARFYSCLVFVPRERYDTRLRQRFAAILQEAFGASSSTFSTLIGDDPLARLHFIVPLAPGSQASEAEIDAERIETALIEAGRSWDDDLREALLEAQGEAKGQAWLRRFAGAFPPGYRERYTPQAAVGDIARMSGLSDERPVGVDLYRPHGRAAREIGLKLYRRERPAPLSACLPILEHMGLVVLEEHPFEIRPGAAGEPALWLHDFHLEMKSAAGIDLGATKEIFEAAFLLVWSGDMEDDGFNQLVLLAGLAAREVTILRAYCKYLRQTGIAFSQAYMEETLAANPALARLLVELFHARFDPERESGREKAEKAAARAILARLEEVASLDQDRILRRFLNLIQATLRTGYYLRDKGGAAHRRLSFKLASDKIADLPAPRPLVEIFVYSPAMEGIHLRGGKVARGGIRWSDRREDFRTEILGLMKAQMVKNAVIVPVGAKGGFVPKRPPAAGGREAILADGIACYRELMQGLLDLTDNRVGDKILPPAGVVRHDGDDPYLVVAADKGTASFSDIANGISADYGYWLGDAFASGGSAGYDHKAMGITARGAFEAVKRHFRELGRDVLKESVSVIGIGDMSGDVFGNGLLQSPHFRLQGAFDHRHIFLDPDPDPASSFAERQRLYRLERSSWEDYDKSLLSQGGGIFPRTAKELRLSPEIMEFLGLEQDRLSPPDLIRALLKAPADLLWIGGIGTYVKASVETHAMVGDHANDPLRVDGRDLRVKVVAEGGNLGFTQRGRIEYALGGGRLNTDAVDNSAGVDCSDHEVNIKILLDVLVAEGALDVPSRNRLLAEMTEDVASLVLADNYQQTATLSLMAAQGAPALPAHARLMRDLESRGRLDRAVEFLPDESEIAVRSAAGRGLTRPEIAVLLAYAKSDLDRALIGSDLPEDPYFAADLARYFPTALRERFGAAIPHHRLRREIVATAISNSLVNRAGIGFLGDIQEETEAGPSMIARAYAAAREIFSLRDFWREIEASDTSMPAALQSEMMLAGIQALRRAVLWLLRQNPQRFDIAAAIEAYAPGVAELHRCLPRVLVPQAAARLEERRRAYVGHGAPEALAERAAGLAPLGAALDIVEVARAAEVGIEAAAALYFRLGEHLGLDWLREAAGSIAFADDWQRLATIAALDDLGVQQRLLTQAALAAAQGATHGADIEAAIVDFEKRQGSGLERLRRDIADFTAAGGIDLARLMLAIRHLRSLRAGREGAA